MRVGIPVVVIYVVTVCYGRRLPVFWRIVLLSSEEK
jgi:hypothetical protein